MHILLADAFPEAYVRGLTERGHRVSYEPELATEGLAGRMPGTEVLVVRSTRVTAPVLGEADALRAIIRAGSGTNTIDTAAATRAGVAVCNVPGRNAVAVAELTFGLLLALDRNIPDNVSDLRAGHWDKARYSRARGIAGRKIGVVGLGEIGLAFAERAAAFGAEVFAVHKAGRSRQTAERIDSTGIRLVADLPTLAETCDVLSLHVPAGENTTGLVDSELLERVRPGTIILNTARPEVIDEDALIEAMDSKDIRAGVDVFAGEPQHSTGTVDSRLARHPNVYGTHHIGASTEQAQHAIAEEVLSMIDSLEGGTVLHCVNPEAATAVPVRSSHAAAVS
ncbi:hydroxyacid dehydrogenase [Haloechinothrix sp. YIM 98757]|uniref:Hydroxyacid dehydrogenase n=1 Tax=Haloechinothrix aidingensis TaxID=2752311 RepID=A0A838AA28_9PSEU|nr:NAD(P)-dependent oxidoreductase [Haloechinothrix aidingensis]MBA0125889.1 hydroxyacid dehydrogenase [Haloechinothrix aidingensis]